MTANLNEKLHARIPIERANDMIDPIPTIVLRSFKGKHIHAFPYD